MPKIGIRSKLARKFRVYATDFNHVYNTYENLVSRQFHVECTSKALVYDIIQVHINNVFADLTTAIIYGN